MLALDVKNIRFLSIRYQYASPPFLVRLFHAFAASLPLLTHCAKSFLCFLMFTKPGLDSRNRYGFPT